jgi:hypothetical protein
VHLRLLVSNHWFSLSVLKRSALIAGANTREFGSTGWHGDETRECHRGFC